MPVSVDLPEEMKALIDRPVEEGIYQSRSELIREAIRQYLEKEGLIERKKISEDVIQEIKKIRENGNYRKLEEVKEELDLE